MPITLEVNYSKKLGLPGYSSHQCSITIRTEITDLKQVEPESNRLYTLLQGCVDRDIQQTGYLPANGQGNNGHTNGQAKAPSHPNGNGKGNGSAEWNCTPKQRDLILNIVAEHQLPKDEIEQLAQERFDKGVKALNKLEASGLIDELIEKYPAQREPARPPQRRTYQRTRA